MRSFPIHKAAASAARAKILVVSRRRCAAVLWKILLDYRGNGRDGGGNGCGMGTHGTGQGYNLDGCNERRQN
ncbi:hypothetical protein U1Q18_051043 [Sarracenia purpurea var. burkii]